MTIFEQSVPLIFMIALFIARLIKILFDTVLRSEI
jgi:hypothetical protein